MSPPNPSIIETISVAWFQLVDRTAAPTFHEWRADIHRRCGKDAAPDDDALAWAWEAIRASPWAGYLPWRLPPAAARWPVPVLALRAGTEVHLMLGADPDRIHLKRDRFDLEVRLVLEENWSLVGSRGNRLQSKPVRCSLELHPEPLGNLDAEALRCGVNASRVKVEGKVLRVEAISLNQAYTIASRRLEPERASHGGRFFERTFVRQGEGWISLEDVRCAAEAGSWVPPT